MSFLNLNFSLLLLRAPDYVYQPVFLSSKVVVAFDITRKSGRILPYRQTRFLIYPVSFLEVVSVKLDHDGIV